MSIVSQQIRAKEQQEINEQRADREALEVKYGQVWDTDQLTTEFAVEYFMAPYVVARRRDTGELGSLQFQHHPRFYFGWKAHQE